MNTFNHKFLPIDLSREIESMSKQMGHVYAQNLETCFVAALTKHVGYLPDVNEVRQHARIIYHPQGHREWQWDGETLMEEHPVAQGEGKFFLPEIVIK